MKIKTSSLILFVIILNVLLGCKKEYVNQAPVANAGNGQSIQLPKDSIELTGTGSDMDGKIISYLWSQVSGPNIAMIVHAGSASTWVKGLVPGSYLFQLMVVDDKGLTGIDTVSIIVKDGNGNQAPVANAGASQIIHLPVDSTTLTGTGTDADGTIISYLWSELAGPNVAYIVHPAQASTKIKGLIAGTYLFQLKVVDNKGLSNVDTVTIFVRNVSSLILKPSNNLNETMLAVKGGANVSDANSPELTAAKWTDGGTEVTIRSTVKFDLSAIPANATITSATLTLYSNPTPLNGNLVDANYGSNNSMLIQRIVSPWDRNTTWQNQPMTVTTDQIVVPHTNSSRLDLIDLDVTNMVKRMVSESNHGFMIKLQDELMYTSRIFCSSKYSDVNKHPKLVVTFQ